MKNGFNVLNVLFAVMVLSFALFLPVSALAYSINGEDVEGDSFVLDSRYPDNIYFAGSEIMVLEDVNGDFVAAGSKVSVDASVYNDILVAANNVYLGGTVGGDVRVAAMNIDVNSDIFGDLVGFGSVLVIEENSSIGKNLIFTGGTVVLNGKVSGDLRISAANVVINGEVSGDSKIDAQTLELGPSSSLRGDLTLAKNVKFDESKVNGEITVEKANEAPLSTYEAGLAGTAMFLIFIVIVGGFLVLVASKFSARSILAVVKKPASSFLIGLAVLILTPVLGVLLLFTIIGIPITIILAVVYVLLILIGLVMGAMAVGRLVFVIFNKESSLGLGLIVGAIAFVLVALIPIVGGLFLIFFVLSGIGATFRSIFSKKKDALKRSQRASSKKRKR
jgi:cytoskeletal protein CcmA (bactofilin family)